jgi:alpha-galactosidase
MLLVFLINLFVQDITEAQVLAAAGKFVSLRLKDAGYQYVNIDVNLCTEQFSA